MHRGTAPAGGPLGRCVEWHVDHHKPRWGNEIGNRGLACEDGGYQPIPSPQGGPQMPHSNPASFRAQVSFLRRQFLQDGELPFTDVLSEEAIASAVPAGAGAGVWK